jgi:mannose-6-phosphate isomerase class I
VVFQHGEALLGAAVRQRFGDEFPIRFDFLDTMGGGNLSLQVHPLTAYIREQFGVEYTQDESYYMLDTEPGATVYLGLKTGVEREEMRAELLRAQEDPAAPFDAERFVNVFPAKRHDHFLIPAGTVHCSGSGSMVLEISATPYIFTFKLWDWGRLGLDGQPRPINIERGFANIQWQRDTAYAKARLVNAVTPLESGEGWRSERTGLHEAEFIDTHRHWFTGVVEHDTGGGVNVLNLVKGEEAIVESPSGAFAPFVVHYAETFIVPAVVGAYTIRPHGIAVGSECATIKAFVRV